MTTEEKLEKAMNLLVRITSVVETVQSDLTFWEDYYTLTGEHMILTEEGWESGDCKAEIIDEYGEGHIMAELNAPPVQNLDSDLSVVD